MAKLMSRLSRAPATPGRGFTSHTMLRARCRWAKTMEAAQINSPTLKVVAWTRPLKDASVTMREMDPASSGPRAPDRAGTRWPREAALPRARPPTASTMTDRGTREIRV